LLCKNKKSPTPKAKKKPQKKPCEAVLKTVCSEAKIQEKENPQKEPNLSGKELFKPQKRTFTT